MSEIRIPAAALEAGARVIRDHYFTNAEDAEYSVRAAFLAMIEAWPGMYTRTDEPDRADTAIILPLPTEASDDK